MENTDLLPALAECHEAAVTGYTMANEQYRLLQDTLHSAEERLQRTIQDFGKGTEIFPEIRDELRLQTRDILDLLSELDTVFKTDLEGIRNNLSDFTITLYGRTMAGKTTLKEVLTEGDGSGIGNGSQRTTLDVRRYTWNGLAVWDVPGIAAFGGEEDREKAYAVAKKSDLVLYLLQDDAPAEEEAKCFSEILALGKPCICIVNIKKGLSKDNIPRSIRQTQKCFSEEHKNGIRNAFLNYAQKTGQDWSRIPFYFVHLLSAFEAQQNRYPQYTEDLRVLSHIDEMKSAIVEAVKEKGKFYRSKSFIDIVANPLLECSDCLLMQSLNNNAQRVQIQNQRKFLKDWTRIYKSDMETYIHNSLKKMQGRLNAQAMTFAETEIENRHIQDAWEKLLAQENLDKECQLILDYMIQRVKDRIKLAAESLTTRLNHVQQKNMTYTIHSRKILNTRRIVRFTSIGLISGIEAVAFAFKTLGVFTATIPYLVPIGIGVGVAGAAADILLKKRGTKLEKAKQDLRAELFRCIEEITSHFEKQLNRSLEQILSSIDRILSDLRDMEELLSGQRNETRELGICLNNRFLDLNREFLTYMLKNLGSNALCPNIEKAARIPGSLFVGVLPSTSQYPSGVADALHTVSTEKYEFIRMQKEPMALIRELMPPGFPYDFVRYDHTVNAAFVSGSKLNETDRCRLKILQQLTGIPVQIKENLK